MKIVRTDAEINMPFLDRVLREQGHELVLLPDGTTECHLCTAVADADLILMCYAPITARVITAAPRLKGIVKYGVGIDAIDIVAAKKAGVLVVNVPDYADNTVAEGALTLMLSLARKVTQIDSEMKRKGWLWPEPRWLGSDLHGKTIGIVGAGRIGRSLAKMVHYGFGAQVLGFDPHVSRAGMQSSCIEKVDDLRTLMAASDFVSIHCVLNPETQHLIGETELRAMKPTAFIINVSRGQIMDETALLHVLQEGLIAGAGLDVYGQEPLNPHDHDLSDLYQLPNVILFPHLTFYTREAMDRLESETLDRCNELINGQTVTIKSADPRLQHQSGADYVAVDALSNGQVR